jgi:SIT family siderophore-iron:H+ symporter-like MFS transporter
MSGGIIGSYFYTYLLVAAGETTLSATRITSIASFTGTWTALAAGLVARYVDVFPIIFWTFS